MQKFRNTILCGDCIEILRQAPAAFADLIFADPPFNIGYQYDRYRDKVEKNNYIAWTRDWMSACLDVLKPDGSFYIAIGDDYAAHVRIIGDELGLTLRNWIIWHYTFGQQTRSKFARAHTHIFYFVKNPKQFTFHDWAVRVPSERQLVYNDKRAQSCGKMPDDVWNTYARVCGTFKERQGWHPCQMPELLLARIIAASSNPGDVVLDPFIGSGTTAAAALQMGRNYCGIDISEQYVENTRKRLDELKKQPKTPQGLSMHELLELKRLLFEISRPLEDYKTCEKLAEILCRQFAIRMNSDKPYDRETILPLLQDLNPWRGRK
ncbi:MAG TPA: site-specific DNA-methyltransferase [Anaerohalosphaeraceae bacterium]|nr:site-specific DNA-methyltransferase [Anaerohalosphaeraceae bacterium]HOT72605.1 site-specific DNA-methyltransferase [Anaerohalosphaeraceae bacterium]HQG05646.1 site-specific DNA-methyltransferase [Anaerohalosphaeraceae bacterium]HQI07298.1 site-specific DNA-methyltransferase [Anaerohalosphaeraceae bacterium]HQJ67595.1 site-specific DNA-methyltransferase [Anaerohalosphaeraceae bacterium]